MLRISVACCSLTDLYSSLLNVLKILRNIWFIYSSLRHTLLRYTRRLDIFRAS